MIKTKIFTFSSEPDWVGIEKEISDLDVINVNVVYIPPYVQEITSNVASPNITPVIIDKDNKDNKEIVGNIQFCPDQGNTKITYPARWKVIVWYRVTK